MRPPAPPPDAFADLAFPVSGVDLSMGYAGQRPGSTRVGVNVRACEPTTQRLRGGQRPGLSEYAGAIPGGAKVQHLNTVVMASGTALAWNFSYPNLDLFDPSSPGQAGLWGPGQLSRIPALNGNPSAIPTGGWMFQPNKNVAAPKSGGVHAGIQFVQAATGQTFARSYSADVKLGNLLLAFVALQAPSSTGATVGVSDDQGNLWTQAGGYVRIALDFGEAVGSLWYAFANASGPDTVFANESDPTVTQTMASVSEWSGVSQVSPFDAGNGQGNALNAGSLSTGSVSVAGSGELLAGFFGVGNFGPGTNAFSAGSGFTALPSTAGVNGTLFWGEYLIGPAGAQAATASVSGLANAQFFGVGASFKPALG